MLCFTSIIKLQLHIIYENIQPEQIPYQVEHVFTCVSVFIDWFWKIHNLNQDMLQISIFKM